MPYKKTTRARKRSCSSDGADTSIKKALKLDFDVKYKEQEDKAVTLTRKIDDRFGDVLAKMPRACRQMSLKDYVKCGGDMAKFYEQKALQGVNVLAKDVNRLHAASSAKSVTSVQGPSNVNRPKGGHLTTGKTSDILASTVGKTPIDSRNRELVPQPASGLPIITPKYDLRKPITSNTVVREPRPDEVLVSRRGSIVVLSTSKVASGAAGPSRGRTPDIPSIAEGEEWEEDHSSRVQGFLENLASLDNPKDVEKFVKQNKTLLSYFT